MICLSEEQLNSLGKEALVILISSLQDQLASMQEQLNTANAHLADNNRQIEFLTEQIRILNQAPTRRQTRIPIRTQTLILRRIQTQSWTPIRPRTPIRCPICSRSQP